jgi:putative ABC transport system substrate-binding protein
MKRRQFIGGLGCAVVWPIGVRAEERPRRLAVLLATAETDPDTPARIAVMYKELQQLGWIEGKNIHVDIRFGAGITSRIERFADELVRSQPDVFFILGTVVAKAIQRLTTIIPTVFVQVSDPVEGGFVRSLAVPGTNMTGFTTYEYSMAAKWLGIIKEIRPDTKRVLLVLNPENIAQWNGYSRFLASAAPEAGFQLIEGPVRTREEIQSRITNFARIPNGSMLVPPDAINNVNRDLIIALAEKHKLPTVHPYRFWAVSGGLVSYGVDVVDQFQRATRYVHRILNGDSPGNLPVQSPTSFQLVVNVRVASRMGISLPQSLLIRADEVIE